MKSITRMVVCFCAFALVLASTQKPTKQDDLIQIDLNNTISKYDDLVDQLTNHDGDVAKERRVAPAVPVDPSELSDHELIPMEGVNRASQYATVSAAVDYYASEGQWTVLIDMYGDGYLYYAYLNDDGLYSWQGFSAGYEVQTYSMYFYEGYNYYLAAYDS